MSQIQGLPPLPDCFIGLIQVQRTVSENSQGDIKEGISHCLNVPEQLNENGVQETDIDQDEEDCAIESGKLEAGEATPFSKLNSALLRLKSEMVIFTANICCLDIHAVTTLFTAFSYGAQLKVMAKGKS